MTKTFVPLKERSNYDLRLHPLKVTKITLADVWGENQYERKT